MIRMGKKQDEQSPVETLVGNRRRYLSFLTGRVANPSDAEEILQIALAKSVEKSDTIGDIENVEVWFYKILRNALIDYYRHRDAERRFLKRLSETLVEPEIPNTDFEQSICRCVNHILPTLKNEYSQLLIRIDYEGASIAEVAVEMNMTANNTRVKLHRARKALREQLEKNCGGCASKDHCLDCTCNHNKQNIL